MHKEGVLQSRNARISSANKFDLCKTSLVKHRQWIKLPNRGFIHDLTYGIQNSVFFLWGRGHYCDVAHQSGDDNPQGKLRQIWLQAESIFFKKKQHSIYFWLVHT